MTLEDAKDYLKIQRNTLDVECERLPVIFWEVSKQYTEAADIRDTLKHEADKLWGKLYVSYKHDKVSDKTAESMADAADEYTTLYKDYLSMKKIADDWNSMKEAYEKKTVMLRELCGLLASGYYTGITVKETVKDSLYETRKKAIMGNEGN